MELAEQVNVAVPSSADVWTDVGTFTVPAGVKRLKKLRFGVAPDHGVAAISVRTAPVFRLIGSGTLEQGDHQYLGMFSAVSVVTTGGLAQNEMNIEYDVDIPVQSGGTFTPQVNTLDEAITAGTIFVNAVYDDQDAKATNSMSQYIDVAGTTSADAYATVGTITIPKTETAKDPKMITDIYIGVAVDQGTSAISLRQAPVIRMSGAGIKSAGLLDYIGPCQTSSHCGTSASQGVAHDNATIRIKDVTIDINAGGQILIEHQFITETPTASTVAVGLVYR